MQQLAEYLRLRSKPIVSTRWLFFRRVKPAAYPFEIRGGASQQDLDAVERRFSLTLPDDLRAAYALMDGMEDYTGSDAGWVRLLPLSDWILLSEENETLYKERFSRNVIFADQGIWSSFHAIELENPEELGWIRAFGGSEPWIIAESFSEYLNMILRDDELLWGPRDDGAAA